MSKKSQKLRRSKLWMSDPHCRRCGVKTVLPSAIGHKGGVPPDNLATIQHMDDRMSPKRGSFDDGFTTRTTLWCYKCNQEDNDKVIGSTDVEELQARSKAGHQRKKGKSRISFPKRS